jgi:tetratricopeptide (TPR) repeat protein
MLIRQFILHAIVLTLFAPPAFGKEADPPTELSSTVKRILSDDLTDLPTQRRLSIFHGQWDQLTQLTTLEQAQVALYQYQLNSPSLLDQAVDPVLRAQAALLRGDADQALKLLADDNTAHGTFLRAQAMIDLGQSGHALGAARQLLDRIDIHAINDPREITAAAQLLTLVARYEGCPANEYHQAMDWLAKAHNELDRLYWPAYLAESELLLEKGNGKQAYEAVIEALQLNPNAAKGWYLLGQMAIGGFQFDRVEQCADKLREVNPQHLLADLLMVHSYLAQKDAAAARAALAQPLHHYPKHRMVLALVAAVEALSYNRETFSSALAHFDNLSPDNPLAFLTAGQYLSLARQYKDAERVLRQAINLEPNWAVPHVELGLLLMQFGDEQAAHKALKEAVRLDPFNIRAINQLKLAEQLSNYKQFRTEHFIIKFRPGIDEVLARDMPQLLEKIYRDITAIYQHRPARPTLIEIMPDEHHFGVRITGMPEIWTVAACTGDVIALTAPRPGKKMRGEFDWARVIRHEFVHTVTLDQTANRIPHWFTEACAVAVEPGSRDYQMSQLLAEALNQDELFDLVEINWAFVRPKRPQDRALAYAQAHWMLEFITERYGHAAIIKMLNRFNEGISAQQAIEYVTGAAPDEFMTEFSQWAKQQVTSWGLSPMQSAEAELLLKTAQETIKTGNAKQALKIVRQYASVRPVDPWAQKRIVELALALGHTQDALAAMEQLDQQEQSTGYWSNKLTQAYRAAGQLDQAIAAANRALQREPYNGTFRELAAAITLQNGDNRAALHHIESLTLLEPDRAIHFVRLAAIHHRMGQNKEAATAAKRALHLDADVSVDRFINSAR